MSERNGRPKTIALEVVDSTVMVGELSLRAWDAEKGRLSATELRRRLREAGYRPGDVCALTFGWPNGRNDK